jgi:hypothetical protein
MKSLKNLFIKEEEEPEESEQKPSFPISGANSSPSNRPGPATNTSNPYLGEIVEVYEKGLESINMPGYDFYDFYLAIKAAGTQNESIYKMAFQMGKTMDANISPQKLASDAEFYVSKINEVYQTYAQKGSEKLRGLEEEQKAERENLTNQAKILEADIHRLKQEIITMEQKLSEARGHLTKVNEKYKPQEDLIKQKLMANDQAMQVSVQKLNSVKEGIMKHII